LKPSNQQLRQWLQAGTVTVTFLKADGSQRVMPCTLREDQLPPRNPSTEVKDDSKPKVDPDPNLFKVWCTDQNVWRSFRYERVVQCQI
jgi:hypothetical protein